MRGAHISRAQPRLAKIYTNHYISAVHNKEVCIMSNTKRSAFAEIMSIIGDALTTAVAVRTGRSATLRNDRAR